MISHPVEGGMAELDIYVTVGLYEDGSPGEIFLRAGKTGSTISGLLDGVAIAVSLGLQSGVPLSVYTAPYTHMQFEPAGSTRDPELPRVTSILDAVARWLNRRFGGNDAESK